MRDADSPRSSPAQIPDDSAEHGAGGHQNDTRDGSGGKICESVLRRQFHRQKAEREGHDATCHGSRDDRDRQAAIHGRYTAWAATSSPPETSTCMAIGLPGMIPYTGGPA